VLDGPQDQPEDELGVPEPDLGLRRVDVDVDVGERERQEQEGLGRPAPFQDARVSLVEGRLQDAVLDRPAVDDNVADLLHGLPQQ
jgi:hypothetical protein